MSASKRSPGDCFSASEEVVKLAERLDDIEAVLGTMRIQASSKGPMLVMSAGATCAIPNGWDRMKDALKSIHERLKERTAEVTNHETNSET